MLGKHFLHYFYSFLKVHKSGSNFQFFSRSLKPVLAHKVCDVITTMTLCVNQKETLGWTSYYKNP